MNTFLLGDISTTSKNDWIYLKIMKLIKKIASFIALIIKSLFFILIIIPLTLVIVFACVFAEIVNQLWEGKTEK